MSATVTDIATWAQIGASVGTFFATAVLAWVTWRLKISTDIMARCTMAPVATETRKLIIKALDDLVEIEVKVLQIQFNLKPLKTRGIDPDIKARIQQLFVVEYEGIQSAFLKFINNAPLWITDREDQEGLEAIKDIQTHVYSFITSEFKTAENPLEAAEFLEPARTKIESVQERLQQKLNSLPKFNF